MDRAAGPVLVLGATGYIGGRLVPLLLERGWRVRAAGSSLRKILGRPWGKHPNLEVVRADALDHEALTRAMQGCQAAYYLIHSITPGETDFAALDRRIAYATVRAAQAARLPRILHFTGLGGDPAHLSEQLKSRYEVGEILGLSGAAVTQLRAPLVLGAGGATFEMIRSLCEHLRLMLAPRWVDTKCQPIAVDDVLEYLAGCLEKPETAGQTYEIGGPDRLTFRELFQLYAEAAGLPKRRILVLPLRTTRLSIAWINLVTPMSVSLVKPLVERMRHEVLIHDTRIREILPLPLLSCREALDRALAEVRRDAVASSCFDAGSTRLPEWAKEPQPQAKVFRDTFAVTLDGPPETAWNVVKRIGGDTGWYFGTFLWRLRGFVDELFGGPGLSRGRRHVDTVAMGDHLDFWRVVEVDEPRRLLLRAEMLAPGEALLEFRVTPLEDGTTELAMTPSFQPRGAAGMLYWWCIAPSHSLIFRPMLRHMARAAGARVLNGPVLIHQGG